MSQQRRSAHKRQRKQAICTVETQRKAGNRNGCRALTPWKRSERQRTETAAARLQLRESSVCSLPATSRTFGSARPPKLNVRLPASKNRPGWCVDLGGAGGAQARPLSASTPLSKRGLERLAGVQDAGTLIWGVRPSYNTPANPPLHPSV